MALTQISTAGVKDDAVTAGKIPANAVGSSELADNAVDTAAIADNAVTAAKIQDGEITQGKLASNSVTTNKIAGNAVGSGELASNAVTTAKIADGNVTAAKLASGVQTTINNQADNRIITATSTSNTLNAEANCTFDGGRFITKQGDSDIGMLVQNTTHDSQLRIEAAAANKNSVIMFADGDDGDVGMIDYDHNDNSLAIDVNAAERMRIDSNGHTRFGPSGAGGDPGWGHSSYVNSEVAIDSPGGYAVLHLRGEGAGSTATRFAIGVGDDKHYLSYDDVDARHNIVVSGDGVVSIPNGIELGSGTDATPAGNILHDYEEGTFTPSHSAVTLSGTVVGHYTKIGDLVYVSAIFDIPSTSNTSDVEIHGLPFNAKNGTDGNYIQGGYTIYSNQGQGFNVLLANNQNTFVVYSLSGQRATMDDFSNKILRLAGVYKVA